MVSILRDTFNAALHTWLKAKWGWLFGWLTTLAVAWWRRGWLVNLYERHTREIWAFVAWTTFYLLASLSVAVYQVWEDQRKKRKQEAAERQRLRALNDRLWKGNGPREGVWMYQDYRKPSDEKQTEFPEMAYRLGPKEDFDYKVKPALWHPHCAAKPEHGALFHASNMNKADGLCCVHCPQLYTEWVASTVDDEAWRSFGDWAEVRLIEIQKVAP